jgi:peptidoglycan-associated lipoprotein
VLPQLPTSSTPRPEGTASDQTTSVRISEELASACGIAQPDAFFAFDSFNLDSSDRSPLSLVAKCFTSGPMKGRSLKLIGHADPRGETEYNMVLGQSRADSVAGFLEGKGLVKDHISTTSRGAMDAKGTDENTWAHDRRVDVMLGT